MIAEYYVFELEAAKFGTATAGVGRRTTVSLSGRLFPMQDSRASSRNPKSLAKIVHGRILNLSR